MARDPRTLSRMISRGEPPETIEDIWMILKRMSHFLADLDGQVAMLRNMVLEMHDEDHPT